MQLLQRWRHGPVAIVTGAPTLGAGSARGLERSLLRVPRDEADVGALSQEVPGHRVRGWDRAETSCGALDLRGRRSGRVISFPVVIADFERERYLVSMLGANVNWVRNLKAAGGRALLRNGRRERVQLDEVEPGARAPILRRCLRVAPGARAHIPVDRTAPLTKLARIAADYPVFRIQDCR